MDYPGENFTQDTEEKDPTVVVKVVAFALVLIERDDLRVTHIVW